MSLEGAENVVPPGCEGWEEMYPRHARFGEDRGEVGEAVLVSGRHALV